jgi:ankyrin repeat protein
MYIAAGLTDNYEERGEFWPKLTDDGIIFEILDNAAASGLTLDVNKIPHEFKYASEFENTEFSSSLLMFAARKNSETLIMRLIEMGADVTLKDKDGHDAIWYAQNSKNPAAPNIAKYLEITQALHKAIFNRTEKNDDSHPVHLALAEAEKALMINKPFHRGNTLLTYAATIKNPFILKTILATLKKSASNSDLKSSGYLDEPTSGSNETALFIASRDKNYMNVLELLKEGANPDLILKDDRFNDEITDPTIKELLEKWQSPSIIQSDLIKNYSHAVEEFETDQETTLHPRNLRIDTTNLEQKIADDSKRFPIFSEKVEVPAFAVNIEQNEELLNPMAILSPPPSPSQILSPTVSSFSFFKPGSCTDSSTNENISDKSPDKPIKPRSRL